MTKQILWFLLGIFVALGLPAVANPPQQPSNPPLVTVVWSPLNPDFAAIISTDRSAGASLVTFQGQVPAPTSDFVLRVASAQSGQIDFHGIVQGPPGGAPTSTLASIALDLCNQINGNQTLKNANIACQINNPGQSTFFGVTHYNDNIMAVTAMTGDPTMKVYNGSLAWDAGPTFNLNRSPGFGAVPPPGSNCGQMYFNAPTTQTPGTASAGYAMLNCTVLNPDVSNLNGELGLFVAHTFNGAPLLAQWVSISNSGVVICEGESNCGAKMGAGTLSVPAHGLYIGGMRICVDPSTNFLRWNC